MDPAAPTPPSPRTRAAPVLRRMAASLLFILAGTWAGLAVLLYVMQPRLVFFPSSRLDATPASAGLAFEDVELTTADGVRLHGWYVPRDDAGAHLLFFHGNAGNISHRLESLRLFHDLGLAVLIIDYRGYGRSEGSPSEQGSYQDARAAWEFLVGTRGVPPAQVVLFGRSLGGAVAAWLASEVQPGAVILESTFTSMVDMGRHYYPYLPARLLVRIHYPTIERLQRIRAPLLLVHSPEDDIVPYELGRRLYLEASGSKQFLEISGDHNTGFLQSAPQYAAGLHRFLSDSLPSYAESAPRPAVPGML